MKDNDRSSSRGSDDVQHMRDGVSLFRVPTLGRTKELEHEREKEITCDAEREYRREGYSMANMFKLFLITSSYLLLVIIMGFFFGAASTTFHKTIHAISHLWKDTVWDAMSETMPSWWFPCVHMSIGTILSGFFVGWIVFKFIPECEEGGTSAVKICLHFGAKVPMHVGVARFILTSIYIGGGNPLGSEAPTLHICAVVASTFYDFVVHVFGTRRFSTTHHSAMVIVGCSCGLSAAFNTPMGGIIYALEEFGSENTTGSSRLLTIWIALGSSAALAVHRLISGNHPFFPVKTEYPDTAAFEPTMILTAFVPIICAVAAHSFMNLTLYLRQLRYKYVKDSISMGVGSILVSLLAALFYTISGAVGYASFTWGVSPEQLTAMIAGNGTWDPALYFVARFFMCAVAVAFGGSGGLFTPALILGGSIGVSTSALLNHNVTDLATSSTVLGMMGMTGFFSALLRLPLTSAIVSYEMTSHLSTRSSVYLPIVLSSLMSYYFADLLSPYDLAQRMMYQDGVDEEILARSVPSTSVRPASTRISFSTDDLGRSHAPTLTGVSSNNRSSVVSFMPERSVERNITLRSSVMTTATRKSTAHRSEASSMSGPDNKNRRLAHYMGKNAVPVPVESATVVPMPVDPVERESNR